MKGGLAAAMWATKVALEQGFRPRGDVVFHVVSDEEVVGNGTREIVARAPAADVTLSVEPTELRLCAAEGGLVHFRIEVEGVEAHASTRYLSVHAGGRGGGGVNAVEKTIKIIVALQELERRVGEHEVAPDPAARLRHAARRGSSSAGRAAAATAGSTCSRTPARRRTTARSSTTCGSTRTSRFEDVRAEVEDVVSAVCRADPWLREHPPRFTWKLGHIYFPPLDLPLDHPAVRTLAECLGPVGLDRDAAGLRRGDRPRLVRRAQPARDHLRARAPRAVPRRRRVPGDGAARPGGEGLRADGHRVVWVAGQSGAVA